MRLLVLISLLVLSLNLSANTILWDDDVIAYSEITVAFLTEEKLERDYDYRGLFPTVNFDDRKFTSRLVISYEKEPGVFFNLIGVTVLDEYYLNRIVKQFRENDFILWAQRVFGHKNNKGTYYDPREYTPSDERYDEQLHHSVMQNDLAWDVTKGEGVVVAITDDGVNTNHEDLKDGLWTNPNEIPGNNIDDDNNGYIDDVHGFNFIHFNGNNHERRLGHGTHVAGIVGARMDNGVGVVGTAPESSLMSIKFYESFDSPRNFSSLRFLEAYVYAIDNGAHIITTSYNIDPYSRDEVYHVALDYAYKNGVLVFNSAGNSGMHAPIRTAYDKVLLVGNTLAGGSYGSDKIASDSNYGVGVDMMAPGQVITSTGVTGGYVVKSGTSMAAPNAAAVAALIWSYDPTLQMEQVAALMMYGCEKIDEINRDKYKFNLGAGRVNSYRSITQSEYTPEIRRIIEADKIRIKIQMNTVFDKASFDNEGSFSLYNIKTNEYIALERKKEYFYGTNMMEFQYGRALKKGEYEFRAHKNHLKDPFGNHMNEDFVHRFRVKR